METITKTEHAFMSDSLPCNPLPFLNRMNEIIKEKGTGAVTSPEYQACLHVINMQSHGSLYRIESYQMHTSLMRCIENGEL